MGECDNNNSMCIIIRIVGVWCKNFIYRYGDKNKTIHTVVKKKTLLTKKEKNFIYTYWETTMCMATEKKDASIDREGQ